jgi:hypothetical protein
VHCREPGWLNAFGLGHYKLWNVAPDRQANLHGILQPGPAIIVIEQTT